MSVSTQQLREYNKELKRHGLKPVNKWTGSDKLFETRLNKFKHGKMKPQTETISLTDICQDLKQEPKAVRARLRRMVEDDPRSIPPRVGPGWSFARKDENKVREIIQK